MTNKKQSNTRVAFAEGIARLCFSKGLSLDENPYLKDTPEGKAWTAEMQRLFDQEDQENHRKDYLEFTAE